MRRVLATDAGGALDSKRQTMIEPIFADTKFNRGIDRFLGRGRSAALSGWRLANAARHLRELWRHSRVAAGACQGRRRPRSSAFRPTRNSSVSHRKEPTGGLPQQRRWKAQADDGGVSADDGWWAAVAWPVRGLRLRASRRAARCAGAMCAGPHDRSGSNYAVSAALRPYGHTGQDRCARRLRRSIACPPHGGCARARCAGGRRGLRRDEARAVQVEGRPVDHDQFRRKHDPDHAGVDVRRRADRSR
jgi:hypothetical protein